MSTYFSVLGNLATAWVEVSRQYILPGVEIVHMVGQTSYDPRSAKQSLKQLERWVEQAQSDLQKTRREVCTRPRGCAPSSEQALTAHLA